MSFHWVPAATNPSWSGLAIYTRQRRTNPDRVELLDWGSHYSMYRTPDRDIYITRDAYYQFANRPLNEDWDQITLIAPYNASYRSFDSKYAMNNITAYYEHEKTNHRREGSWRRDGQIWISDSGGYQFKLQSIRYIDPVQVVDWYSKNSDIGIALDIPVGLNFDLLHSANKVQKRNTRVMLESHRPDLRLMTALHGRNREEYLKSADYLYNEKINNLSFSGFYVNTLTESLIALLSVHQEHGKHYDHYHVLGVSDAAKVMAIARWAETRVPQYEVTADSSSHLQQSLRWYYYARVGVTSRYSRISIGSDSLPRPNFQNSPRVLPCQCPICRALKYVEVFALTNGGAIIPYMLLYHNQFAIQEFIRNVVSCARELTDSEYMRFAEEVVRRKDQPRLKAGMDIIEKFDSMPSAKIEAAYRYYAERSLDSAGLLGDTDEQLAGERAYLKKTIKGYLRGTFSPEEHMKSNQRNKKQN